MQKISYTRVNLIIASIIINHVLQGFLSVVDKERDVKNILLVNREKLEALVSELLTRFDKEENYCPAPSKYVVAGNFVQTCVCL